jgi:putative transposase
MLEEHGVEFNHATLNRWVIKYVPLLEREFRTCKHPAGPSWRMDETYVRVKGTWKYPDRPVDKAVDFLLTAKPDRKAALRFLRKAIRCNGAREKITIHKCGANTAATENQNAEHERGIEVHQVKCLNNIVEQDHRAINRLVWPMLGFKSFRSGAMTLAGTELLHMNPKVSYGRQATCIQRSNSIRCRDKLQPYSRGPHAHRGNLQQNPSRRRMHRMLSRSRCGNEGDVVEREVRALP